MNTDHSEQESLHLLVGWQKRTQIGTNSRIAWKIVSRILLRILLTFVQDYLADLATIADTLTYLEHVIVVGQVTPGSEQIPFDTLRQGESIGGPVAVDPDGPALIGYTSGTTPTPKGWSTPIARSAVRCGSSRPTRPSATGPTSPAPRSATPSACWLACCARWSAAVLSTSLMGGTRRRCSTPWWKSRSARGRLDLFLYQPAR